MDPTPIYTQLLREQHAGAEQAVPQWPAEPAADLAEPAADLAGAHRTA